VTWEHLKGKLAHAGIEYLEERGTSSYFRDPNGAQLALMIRWGDVRHQGALSGCLDRDSLTQKSCWPFRAHGIGPALSWATRS
jgi:hypothetical protein